MKTTAQIVTGEQEDPWYEHHEHLTVLSMDWPQVLFTLTGRGEDREEYWKTYYMGGRSKTIRAEFVFPDFDLTTLEKPDNNAPSKDQDLQQKLDALDTQLEPRKSPSSFRTPRKPNASSEASTATPPSSLDISHVGRGHIAITAGHRPGPSLTLILSEAGSAVCVKTVNGETKSRSYPRVSSWLPDGDTLKDLGEIRMILAA